jgi:hypothetical protein
LSDRWSAFHGVGTAAKDSNALTPLVGDNSVIDTGAASPGHFNAVCCQAITPAPGCEEVNAET